MAFSNQQISSFVNSNLNDPNAIIGASNRYGVGLDQILGATGYSQGQAQDWMNQNGVNSSQFFGGATGANPYLGGMADDIQRRSTDMMNQGIRGARGDAIMAGGFGGSGQGILEGRAIQGATDALSGNLAGLYGGAYNQDQNRGLQRYGMDQNFYTQQRGQDQTGMALGAGLLNQGLQSEWMPLQNQAGLLSNFTGFGSTTTSANSGGGWQGALGGMLGMGQMGQNFGWWGQGGE